MWFAGTRIGGVVERIGDTRVETSFAHFNYLPIAPNGSFLVLGPGKVIPIRAHGVSLLAGYARAWGWAVSLLILLTSSGRIGAIAALAAFVGWIGSFSLGKLGPEERARRSVYAKVTGFLADPYLLVSANPSLREHLDFELQTRTEELSPDGYRSRAADWRSACDAPTVSAEHLAIALTLARIDRDRRLHARIWSRLSKRTEELPDRVEPRTRVAGQEKHLEPRHIDKGPIERLPFGPGNAIEAGWDVTIRSQSAIGLPFCASCMQATSTTTPTRAWGPLGPKTLEIPICPPCRSHAFRSGNSRTWIKTVAFAVAMAAGGIGLISRFGPLLASISAALLGAVIYASFAFVRPPPRALAPATVGRTAARLVSVGLRSMTIHCTNEAWARQVADRAGTKARPRRRLFSGALAGIGLVTLAVQPVLFGVYWLAHPAVKIDNGTGVPIIVWVDGEERLTIPPVGPDAVRLPLVRVGWGAHSFEWAPAERPELRFQTNANIRFNGSNIWDPGATRCYDVVVSLYGEAKPNLSEAGPRPRTEVYSFSHIHDWFSESPKESAIQGEVRYAFTRDPYCAKMAACGERAEKTYWDCMLLHDREATAETCLELARTACDQ